MLDAGLLNWPSRSKSNADLGAWTGLRQKSDVTAFDPVQFVAQNGVVLASGKGPVPSVAEAVAGEPIRGSWWGHAKGSEIFHALGVLDDSTDVLCFKLIDGKNTFVHRRLWPALVRLAEILGKERVTAIKQEHTASGAHRNVSTPFPKWVPAEAKEQASRLSESEARAALGPWTDALASKAQGRGRSR